MNGKTRILAWESMCLFNEFDTSTAAGIMLAQEEWDDSWQQWEQVILFLRDDIDTEPPGKGP